MGRTFCIVQHDDVAFEDIVAIEFSIRTADVFQKGTIGGYVVAGIGGVELLFAKKTGVRISKRIFNGFGNAVFCKIVD